MRDLLFFTFMVSVAVARGAGAADANAAQPPPRVRSENADIAGLISRASEASPTFRRLLEVIDRTDGLVYVEYGKCGHGVQACVPLIVTAAGPFRILHIMITSSPPDCRLMARVGHELQHAIEILSDPHIRSGAGAYMLYDRIAGSGALSYDRRFETEDAQRVGSDVGYECRGPRR
jgi:hypothetical protein